MTLPASSPGAPPAEIPASSPGDTERAGLLAAAWRLDPGVAVRPEPFGALLYHFGTRRLSFVRSLEVVAVLRALDGAASARAACDIAGVPPERLALTARALMTLAASGLIQQT